MSTQKQITEIEGILSQTETQLQVIEPRWMRKQRECLESSTTTTTADRFVPQPRTTEEIETSHHFLVSGAKNAKENTSSSSSSPTTTGSKILTFTHKAPTKQAGMSENLRVLYSGDTTGTTKKSALSGNGATTTATKRYIAGTAERVLDAPGMEDDYYLNLMDWNPENILAVALGRTVYLWSAESGEIHELTTIAGAEREGEDEGNIVTSVKWMRGAGAGGSGGHLAIGNGQGEVQLWDCERGKQLRSMRGHTARVGALTWHGSMVASGSRDSVVMLHDVRRQQHLTATLQGHVQEVCGLEFSPSGTQLASGGNDNILNIWDVSTTTTTTTMTTPRFTLTQHVAAVKALGWCPWQQNLLASGGGTADRCIRFWNTESGACVNCVDTHSQVTSLQWSTTHRELVSAHGFSNNQLTVWKYPTLERVTDLMGHDKRILHTSRSPDGSVVVSAGADETLRFWSIWPVSSSSSSSSSLSLKAKSDAKVESSFCFPQLR